MAQTLEGEFAEEIKESVENQRAEMAEKEQERLDALKEKHEKLGLPINEDDYQVNAEALQPRYPVEILYKLYKMRLNENDCQNRGYVMEGFPKTLKDAEHIFMDLKSKEGEEEDEENKVKVLNSTFCPKNMFVFEAEDEAIKEKVKRFPEEMIKNTHYDEAGMQRRLHAYRELNDESAGKDVIRNFFETHNVAIKSIDVFKQNVLEQMKFFVERNGKFKNFMRFEEEEEALREVEERKKKLYHQRQQDDEIHEREQRERELRELTEEVYKLNQKESKEKQDALLKQMSTPMIDYLEANLMPFVQDGIQELIQKYPENPLDYLAEYLFRRSLEVQCSDPLAFKK